MSSIAKITTNQVLVLYQAVPNIGDSYSDEPLHYKKKKGGIQMNEAGMISELKAENAKLKDDNDMLQNIIAQMHVTLDRLILNYVLDGKETL